MTKTCSQNSGCAYLLKRTSAIEGSLGQQRKIRELKQLLSLSHISTDDNDGFFMANATPKL